MLTPTQMYAISVPDPVFFAQTMQSNQSRGALFEQRQAVHRWGIAAQSFWLDPFARTLTIALIAAFIAVLGYMLHIYPGLSQSVPLRFPSLGGVVRVSDKSELLDIPRSAAGFLAVELRAGGAAAHVGAHGGLRAAAGGHLDPGHAADRGGRGGGVRPRTL